MGLGTGITLPCTKAFRRLVQSKRKIKCHIEGEWEFSAQPGTDTTELIGQGVIG